MYKNSKDIRANLKRHAFKALQAKKKLSKIDKKWEEGQMGDKHNKRVTNMTKG